MTTTEERFRGLPLVETTDLDEALQVTADVFLPHHLQVLERSAPLQMKLNAVHMECLTAGYLRYGPEVRMRTTRAGHYHVNIALTGAVRSRSGRRDEVDSARSHAAVFMPGEPADILWGAESAQLCLMLARDRVDRELESLLGHPLGRALEFDVGMDLTTSAAAAWMDTVELVEREATRPNGLTRFPLAAAHLESLVIDGLLLAQSHNYSDALAIGAAPRRPRAVREALQLIEDQPDRPWSTATLAARVGVSARTLQEGFASTIGVPPMTHLRAIRLDRIHAELSTAEPGSVNVGTVAARWGFVHGGRFAAAYRRRFGCTPAETARGVPRHASSR
jgi:AraC-like DNA-binding protein